MLSTGRQKRKYTEPICKNCKHWEKSHKCAEYDLWVGICLNDKAMIDIDPYENSDCEEWERK